MRRAAAAARALLGLAVDPKRIDLVFSLTEALNADCFARVARELGRDAAGSRILAERPSIDSRHVDFAALAALPEATLGREYVRFLAAHDITPDLFQPPAGFDETTAYMTLRIRQTHDLWHVLTGYEPDVYGEIILSAFNYAQLRAPSSLAIVVFGALRYGPHRPGFLGDIRRAYRRGRATRPLASFYWEDHWLEPVAALRERLGCPA
jgi:ubiquinone biosynthesis protein COQ4